MLRDPVETDVLRVVNAVAFDRMRPILDKLRSGTTLEVALNMVSPSPSDRDAISRLAGLDDCGPRSLAILLEALYTCQESRPVPPEVVWTGPRLPAVRGIRSTLAVTRELILSARSSLDFYGYVIQPELFPEFGMAGALQRGIKVSIAVDATMMAERERLRLIAVGVAARRISVDFNRAGKFHAKLLIADDERALVTSANFTKAGLDSNIEVGMLVCGEYVKTVSAIMREYTASS